MRILIITILCFFIFHKASAQNFGIRLGGGGSNAKLGNDGGNNLANNIFSGSITGHHIFSITEKTAIDVELQAISKGYKFNIKNYLDQGNISARMRMNFISLNTVFLWSPFTDNEKKKRKRKKKKKNYIFGGLYNSINVLSNWRYLNETTFNKDLLIKLKKYDLGLTGGLKISQQVSKTKTLILDFRYSHGILNLLDHSFNSLKLRNFEIGIGYYFMKKKKRRK